MGPKIQAVIEFLEGGGWMGLITNPPNIGRALAGETGTFIVREGAPAFTFHN
jgi:carbamate kinase